MTEEETQLAAQILSEIADGTRKYPAWYYEDYQEVNLGDDGVDDDPSAIDPETLGKWDPSDLETQMEYEFDVAKGDEDPNLLDAKQFHFLEKVETDEEGIEVGYDPIYGSSNPIDERTMAAWTETLIRDCGVECTGVVFETGWRKRDPYYDSGDKWFGPY